MREDREIRRLRKRIAEVDQEIVDAVARRMGLSAKIGERKAMEGLEIEAKEVEATVLARARGRGKELGLDEDLLEELFDVLIRHSKREQRRHRGLDENSNPGT